MTDFTFIGGVQNNAVRQRIWSAPINGTAARRYDYNHKNERTMRIGSNQFRHFAYDEQSHLIGGYDFLGNAIVEYVWLGDKLVAALYPNNQIVFLMSDHTGTPRRGLDLSTNQIVWAWNPDAFGMSTPDVETVEMNLHFLGQYYDEATGLHYMNQL